MNNNILNSKAKNMILIIQFNQFIMPVIRTHLWKTKFLKLSKTLLKKKKTKNQRPQQMWSTHIKENT